MAPLLPGSFCPGLKDGSLEKSQRIDSLNSIYVDDSSKNVSQAALIAQATLGHVANQQVHWFSGQTHSVY